MLEKLRENVTIDWTIKETVRAKVRVIVRRTLTKCGYSPDLCEEATKTVMEQAELLRAEWAADSSLRISQVLCSTSGDSHPMFD